MNRVSARLPSIGRRGSLHLGLARLPVRFYVPLGVGVAGVAWAGNDVPRPSRCMGLRSKPLNTTAHHRHACGHTTDPVLLAA